MTIQFEAGETKRGNLYWISPSEIIVKEENRGRWKPPSADAIIRMAESLIKFGQREPVQCRKIENKRLQLVMGFTRAAAGRLILQGFTNSKGEVVEPDPKFRLQCTVALDNEKEAFLHNIVENAIRNDTSPMDDAFNQRKLTEMYGYDDSQIAEVYGWTGTYAMTKIKNLRRLLELDDFFREKVHYGELPVQTALTLLDVAADKRMEIFEAAYKNGKVDGQVIRQEAREAMLAPGVLADEDDAPFSNDASDTSVATSSSKPTTRKAAAPSAAAPPTGALIPRTQRELRSFLTEMKDSEDATDGEKNFAKVALGWMGGSKSNQQFKNAIRKLQE